MKDLCRAALIACVILYPAFATAASSDPLFQDDSTLAVVITAPLTTLIRERPKDRYLPGTFSFREGDGTAVELDLEVRARGNFRLRNCDFPPLYLKFSAAQVGGTLLENQERLKLVAPCKDSARYQQSVLREYLAYRILNALTDLSFRVRLLQVTWVDSDERRGRMVRNAFLIEHDDRLAERLGMKALNFERTEVSAIRPDHLNLTELFQYLIGNTDFSPNLGSDGECCHNYAMFGNGGELMLAIPYDFDMAGFVYAPYAEPDPDLGIENVRQRLYLGHCVNNGFVDASIARFQEVRDTLYALLAGQQDLEPAVRQSIASYMDEFYVVIENPEAVEQQLIGKCI